MRTRAFLAGVVGLLLLLSGCGSDQSGGGGGAKTYKLTLVQGVKGDEFYISMACGAQAAAKAGGATLDVTGPDKFDATLQAPVINAVIAKKPDAVLVAPNDVSASIPPLTQMKQAGIKVVEVDTHVNDPSISVSKIASDNLGGGKEAAKALAGLLGSKSGSVMVINVKPGISTTDQRQQGFEEEIKSHSNLKYIGTQFNQDEPAKAASIVTATLAAHKDLLGIFATNLFAAEGAATGLRNAGNKNVKIVGFDAGPKQVEDLRSGVIQALVAQKPLEIGQLGVEQALHALKGEPVQGQIQTGFVVATKDNVDDPDVSKFLYKSSCT
jgi:ribose transport system substrate-binding protein